MLECRVDTVNCVLPSKAATHYKFLILSPKSISCYLLPPHIAGVSVLLLILFTAFIRYQTLVGDKQFLKSMIPHHAGAILMCDNPNLRDQEIKDLCKSITIDQQKEIDWMKNKLDELERKQ